MLYKWQVTKEWSHKISLDTDATMIFTVYAVSTRLFLPSQNPVSLMKQLLKILFRFFPFVFSDLPAFAYELAVIFLGFFKVTSSCTILRLAKNQQTMLITLAWLENLLFISL